LGALPLSVSPIGHEPLESPDGDRLIDPLTAAFILATAITNPATDGGEGVLLLDGSQGVLIPSLSDEGYITLGSLVDGTGSAARGSPSLLDDVGGRHRLGVREVDRPIVGLPPYSHWAVGLTATAGDTPLLVHIAGVT
jgi:hypothetical protein